MTSLASCRFHDVPVPTLGSDVTLRRVEMVLSASGMRILALDSPAEALHLDSGAYACLLEFGSTHQRTKPSALENLKLIALHRPSLPTVALRVNGSHHETGADLAGLHPSWNVHVVEWPAEEESLARRVVLCRFWIWTDALSAEVTAASHLPHLIRAALRWILRMRVSYPPLSDFPPEWTLTVIAKGIGCSIKVLSQTARRAGVNLHTTAETWVALNLLVLHEVNQVSWERLALAVGYEGLPGLSQLTLRVLGQRPRSLSGGGIEVGLQRFEGLFREAVARR